MIALWALVIRLFPFQQLEKGNVSLICFDTESLLCVTNSYFPYLIFTLGLISILIQLKCIYFLLVWVMGTFLIRWTLEIGFNRGSHGLFLKWWYLYYFRMPQEVHLCGASGLYYVYCYCVHNLCGVNVLIMAVFDLVLSYLLAD